jgi:hypothetical protein
MSHYAQVKNGIVVNVIVAEQDFIDTLENPSEWVQTSYNTFGNVHLDPVTRQPDGGIPLRGNYASMGNIYDTANNVFYEQQPFPSWSLNNNTWTWEPPIPYPQDKKTYYWDESSLNWILINPPAK